jgi:tRNA(fMet)-specific endonuclease VapC
MATHLLDTNICIAIINGETHATAKLKSMAPSDVAISSVTVMELLFGAYNGAPSRRASNLAAARSFLRPLQILHFDEIAADFAAKTRFDLKSTGKHVGSNDLLISASALQHNLTCVTRNTREFTRVSGLTIEDWS